MIKLPRKKPLKNRLETIIEKTKEDVRIVKNNAVIVMKISPDEKSPSVVENEKGRIKVIAVIGPADLAWNEQKIHFEETLLCEIGMIRTRPYRLTEGKKSERPTNKGLHSRSKRFSLTENQYRFIAPTLFNLVIEKAQKKCSKRLRKGWKIYADCSRWSKSQKKFESKKKLDWWPRGARFSISKKDELLLGDIYWASLQFPLLRKRINSVAGIMGLVLNTARRKGIPFAKFQKSENGYELRSSINRIPAYTRKILAEKYLKKNPDNFLRGDICELLNILPDDRTEEALIKEAEKLDESESRVGDIQLMIDPLNSYQRKTKKTEKNYVVIEVFPFDIYKAELEELSYKHPQEDDDLSDIPF